MYTLADSLEMFNKAEPDLMIRDAFGHRQKKLCLSEDFRTRLENEANLGPVPENAWWAIEYPFSCLAGALALYAEGPAALARHWPNTEATFGRVAKRRARQHQQSQKRTVQQDPIGRAEHQPLPRLATGGREDADFIISYGNHLILLEAKAYTFDSNKQIDSKLDRIDLLYDFYTQLPGAKAKPIEFRFILWSPARPVKVEACWPSFAKSESQPHHITMDLVHASELYSVSRTGSNGDRSYPSWHIKPESRRAAARKAIRTKGD